MASIPLISNPILPPVPDEPKDFEDPEELHKTFDALWKWMKDLSVQLKILLGSPQGSNSALTLPLVQAGTAVPFCGPVANMPAGYLACDGSLVSSTQYASLFSAIGSSWNTGGESAGIFRLPDFRGRVPVGAGTGTGLTPRTIGQIGGEENHQLTVSELAVHDHVLTDPGHVHGTSDPEHAHEMDLQGGIAAGAPNITVANGSTSGSGSGHTESAKTGLTVNSATTGIAVANAGGNSPHNNMQPFGVVTWIIKY